jgi:glucose-1-phosphate cytidylyltransferase
MVDTLEDMKVVILAGGLGTRLAEETDLKPKPMVEIGGRPILWHIMMQYGYFGLKNFVIALGYKGEVIKKYMADYSSLGGNLTVNMRTGQVLGENNYSMDWMVELIDTGPLTETGGRLKKVAKRLGNKTFMLTYGDGVSDVDIRALLAFHRSHGKLATLTAVRPPARFGHMDFDGDQVSRFSEKSQTDVGWINGGFFVLEPEVIDYIDSDDMKWERDPLERLAAEGQLMAYKHPAFWQCMDTLRDKQLLQKLWDSGEAPWKVWEREHASNGNRP